MEILTYNPQELVEMDASVYDDVMYFYSVEDANKFLALARLVRASGVNLYVGVEEIEVVPGQERKVYRVGVTVKKEVEESPVEPEVVS
jgi:hypothetical protein